MFKKISEAYAVLSNPERRKKYDKYGSTGKDDDFGFGDEQEFEAFMSMFGGMGPMFSGGAGFGDDFDDFVSFLEKDDLKFKQMFRGLGRNYRGPIGGQKRGNLRTKNKKKYGAGGGASRQNKKEEEMMEEMMAAMMMGEMMGMGMDEDDLEDGFGFGMDFNKMAGMGKMPKNKQKSKATKKAKEQKPKKEEDDDGWETDSEEELIEKPKAESKKETS